MPGASRPFGGKDTASLDLQFTRARVILTATFVGIMAFMLLLSGGITREVFSYRLEYRIRRVRSVPYTPVVEMWIGSQPQEVQDDLLYVLVIVNGALLGMAGVLGYVLAGVTLRPIRESYDRQRRFISDASHELRTPLSILQAGLENEKDMAKQPEEADRVNSHLEEVSRMGMLVSDLLTLSRLDEEGVARERRTIVDLSSLVQEAANRFSSLAQTRGVQIKTSVPEKEIHVLADRELLMQAIGNILKNAIAYNKPGGSVTASLLEKKGKAWLRIEDTGLGLAPDETARIFERFYRVDKSRSRESGGSGLGLAITKSILDRHEGTIEMESKKGEGTVVTMTLSVHGGA
ncbi:hypothetical protein HYV73_01950 [Candidatus Uhrbacteria bacterium]|nr:hypothetical protein [Candidatus Uhrbacteria bacterium]